METLRAISQRASLKTCLAARDVEQDKIDKVLEAAILAPSARNMQPWRFIVVKGKKNVQTLVTKAFAEVNQMVKEAPVVIVACANPKDDAVIGGREYYLFDVGMAVENMILAATDLGLVTHLMTAVNEDELKAVLGVPAEVRFVVATPLAYPAQGSYDEAAKERLSQRTRRSLKEVAYLNSWEEEPA
ncbi:MAG: nitroreductase family protein [Dehalococcoidia bacterium]